MTPFFLAALAALTVSTAHASTPSDSLRFATPPPTVQIDHRPARTMVAGVALLGVSVLEFLDARDAERAHRPNGRLYLRALGTATAGVALFTVGLPK